MDRRRPLGMGIAYACALMAFVAAWAQAASIYALDAAAGIGGIAALGPEFVAKDAWVEDTVGNGDGIANPGERLQGVIRLRNAGFADAVGASVTISTENPFVYNLASHSAPPAPWPAGETRAAVVGMRIAEDAPIHDVTVIVTVTAENGGPWHFVLSFPIAASEMEFSKLDAWTDDPAPDADANGEANPGERLRVGLRLRNEGPDEATGVRLSLTSFDPDITVVFGEARHTSWPAGEERDTEFLVDISDTAQSHGAPLFVSVVTDEGGMWQFSIVVVVSGLEPEFVLRNFWAFDAAPGGNSDGSAAPGESISPRLRLRNDGDGDAHGVRVSLSTSDPDLTIEVGTYARAAWSAATARTVDRFLVRIASDARPHDAELVVDIVDEDRGAWRFDAVLPIVAPQIEFVDRNFWLFDAAPAGNGDGVANPGERVYPRVRLKHAGLDIAHDVTVMVATSDPDVGVVNGSVTHVSWGPGEARNSLGLALDIARDATPHDAAVDVTVTAAHGGLWQFSFVVPIAYKPVEFVLRNSWIFDPEPGGDRDGLAEAGERVLPRIRLRHVGAVAAEDVTVTISVDDPDVAVVSGTASPGAWPAGTAVTLPGLALDIARDATPHDVTVSVHVRSAGMAAAEYHLAFAIDAPAVEFVAQELSLRDEGPWRNMNGEAEAGETIRPIARLKHIGSTVATDVHVAVIIDDPDITVDIGQLVHASWEPGEERDNDHLRFMIAEDAQPHDVVITITVTAANGGPWLFTYTIAVGEATRFVVRNHLIIDVVTDGYHDGKADPGDQVMLRLDVASKGPSVATNVQVTIDIEDADVVIVNGTYTAASIGVLRSKRVRTFILDIAPDARPHDVRARVTVEADDIAAIESDYTFAIAPEPATFELDTAWLWDPPPTGNNDKQANPGERVFPRIRLRNTGTDAATNVRVSLVMQSGDVEVASNLTSYDEWPGGAGRNASNFVVQISPTAEAGDTTAIVSVTADTGGPWQFTYTVPIVESPPDFAQRPDWIWDPSPGGNANRVANPGESVRWALRLKNTGGSAQNAVASIVINDDDVTVVRGSVSHADWAAKEAKTNVFVLDIAPDATAHDITATVSVTADTGGPWQFTISRTIVASAGGAVALLANFPNPFNPDTWIPFSLSEDAETTVRIYDSAGRQVRRLDLGWLPAGAYRRRATAAYWDGRNAVGETVSSGVYIYELRAGSYRQMRRMIVRK